MSRNKEIKFAKWWEENILDEYRNEKHNYFLDNDWFNSLPKDLKEIILGAAAETFINDFNALGIKTIFGYS